MSIVTPEVDMSRVVLVKSLTTGRACAKQMFRILSETDKTVVLVPADTQGNPHGTDPSFQRPFRTSSIFILPSVEAANEVLMKSESYYQLYLEAERRVEEYAEELYMEFSPK